MLAILVLLTVSPIILENMVVRQMVINKGVFIFIYLLKGEWDRNALSLFPACGYLFLLASHSFFFLCIFFNWLITHGNCRHAIRMHEHSSTISVVFTHWCNILLLLYNLGIISLRLECHLFVYRQWYAVPFGGFCYNLFRIVIVVFLRIYRL
jgi:hypothetical protein